MGELETTIGAREESQREREREREREKAKEKTRQTEIWGLLDLRRGNRGEKRRKSEECQSRKSGNCRQSAARDASTAGPRVKGLAEFQCLGGEALTGR